jgi:O-antigen/teichoic acid export membrane protein
VAFRIVGILATVASNVLAARLLGPAEFGRYLFLASVAVCGSLVGAAGLSDTTLRFSSESLALGRRGLAAAYVRRTARLCGLSTLLAAGITAAGLLAFHLTTGRLAQPLLLGVLTVLTAAALSWQQLASETLRGWNRLKAASLFSGGTTGGPVSNLLFVAAIIALLQAQVAMSATAVVGILTASVCLTSPVALACVWRMIRRSPAAPGEPTATLSAAEDRQLRAMAGTMLALNLLAFVSEQLDIWIGGALLSPEQLGLYGVAKRSMLLAAMPVQMAMLAILAAIPRLHAQGRRPELQHLMRGSAALAAVPSLAALALLVVFPETVLHWVFGGSYAGAAPMTRILAIGYVVLVFVGNPSSMLVLTGRHRSALSANLVAAAVFAVGGPLAAVMFGATGLAWISASAVAVQNALQWWLARQHSGIWTHVGLPLAQLSRLRGVGPESSELGMAGTKQLDSSNAASACRFPLDAISASTSQSWE